MRYGRGTTSPRISFRPVSDVASHRQIGIGSAVPTANALPPWYGIVTHLTSPGIGRCTTIRNWVGSADSLKGCHPEQAERAEGSFGTTILHRRRLTSFDSFVAQDDPLLLIGCTNRQIPIAGSLPSQAISYLISWAARSWRSGQSSSPHEPDSSRSAAQRCEWPSSPRWNAETEDPQYRHCPSA